MKNLGKLMNYEVVGNEIKLKFSEQVASVFVINSDIIRFFVPCFREGEVSKAIEEMLSSKCEFMVSQASCDKGERLQITTSQLCVEITEGFNVNIYDRQGKLLCGDYIGDEKGFVRRSADYSLAEAEGHDVAGEEMQYKICVKKTATS